MKPLYYALLFFSLTACAVNVTPLTSGGSKADGTVIASYEYGSLQQPIVNMEAANQSAEKRCKAWGYKKAEAFDAVKTECVYMDSGDCIKYRADITYQCIK